MQSCCDGEHTKTDRDGLDAFAGTDDRTVDLAVRVAVLMAVMVGTVVRTDRQSNVSVRAVMVVLMRTRAVPVRQRAVMLSRSQVGRELGVSNSTVRRFEGSVLHPVKASDGKHWCIVWVGCRMYAVRGQSRDVVGVIDRSGS